MSPVAKVRNLDTSEILTKCQNFECQNFKIAGNRGKRSLDKICFVIVVRGSKDDSPGVLTVVVAVFINMNSFLSEIF